MNIETFNNLLDAHGADIQSWPDPEAAQEFLQRVPKVREELALALAIEQELATRATQAPATLAAQILSKLPDQPKPHTLLWRELLSLFPKDRAWIPAASASVPQCLSASAFRVCVGAEQRKFCRRRSRGFLPLDLRRQARASNL